jgi:hypothetical protein
MMRKLTDKNANINEQCSYSECRRRGGCRRLNTRGRWLVQEEVRSMPVEGVEGIACCLPCSVIPVQLTRRR